ncbi:MAG: transposase [Solirubrobacteraceae bacterium]
MGSYAGIDWASEKHDVLIADEAGQRLLAETFAHDEHGIGGLCDALVCFGATSWRSSAATGC